MGSFKLNVLVEIVRKASLIITEQGVRSIARSRSSSDYTTFTDLKVENFIKDKLIKLSPKSLIIVEESFDPESVQDWKDSAFVLDPVDGTINFHHNCNSSAISLAFFEDGLPLYSVILDPFRNELFAAERGCGATMNGSKIKVSAVSSLRDALVGFGTTPYDKVRGLQMIKVAGMVYPYCQDIRRLGAAALDLAYVACGRLDSFFEMDLKSWDFYGGLLLLTEAGGKVSDWNGENIEGLGKRDILATNGLLHAEMLDRIQM